MRVMVVVALTLLGVLAMCGPSAGFTRTAARYDGGQPPILSTDRTLAAANVCSGWIWLCSDVPGAVWGTVLNPQDCVPACTNGGLVSQVYLYTRCTSVPGRIEHLDIHAVDGVGCFTTLLYESPPITIVHCASGDRWTVVATPRVGVNGNPFAVSVTWGPRLSGVSNPELAVDNALANLYCAQNPGAIAFPGCASSTASCAGWISPPERTFIFVTDLNGDGVLDDLCAIYGQPYAVGFDFLYAIIYENLVIGAGLDCTGEPISVQPSTWGHVKALFE